MTPIHPTLLLLLVVAPLALAEPVSDLDAVLEGFDNPGEQTDPAIEDVLGGFDSNDTATAPPTVTSTHAHGDLNGEFSLSTTYNYAHEAPSPGQTDWRGLSRLRSKLDLEYEYRFENGWRAFTSGYAWYDMAYTLNGRNQYTPAVLDTYESELELGETFLQGRLNRRTDLTVGRKIVVWGKSDNLRVTDVINPLDMREIGMVDIEDLRLPLSMAKLDVYLGDWGLSAMAIPELRFNRSPAYGSDFYPVAVPPLPVNEPSNNNTEYALAANGIFSGWDLSLYWARLYDDEPYYITAPSGLQGERQRYTFNGLATNIALGNWLWKGEAAYLDGLRYTGANTDSKSRTDLLLGIEYSGLHDTTLSFEVVNRHINRFDSLLAAAGHAEDSWQSAARYSGEFMHARLKVIAVASLFGAEFNDGGFVRLQADYALIDNLNLSGGLIDYIDGSKPPFNAINDNDRVFAEIRYSF